MLCQKSWKIMVYVETRDKHIFAHNFLNIQLIFNQKKVWKAETQPFPTILSNTVYVEACWRGWKSKLGWGEYGCVGGVPCMHTWECMHAHTCMFNIINMDASMLVAICNFYTYIYVCTCVHVWGHLPCPQMLPTHLPLPRATGSPKHQNSISPELIKIIQFCLKILYLWTHMDYSCSPQDTPHPPAPPPRAKETQIRKITISLEWIWDNSILFEDFGPLNPPAHI